VVHFYPAEDVLAAQVGRYLAEGIASGNGVLVVATAAHRRGFAASLAAEGVDAGRAERDGRLLTALPPCSAASWSTAGWTVTSSARWPAA
jgi:KaiC/GvpD/RAD55 family RecA-like ATPase